MLKTYCGERGQKIEVIFLHNYFGMDCLRHRGAVIGFQIVVWI